MIGSRGIIGVCAGHEPGVDWLGRVLNAGTRRDINTRNGGSPERMDRLWPSRESRHEAC